LKKKPKKRTDDKGEAVEVEGQARNSKELTITQENVRIGTRNAWRSYHGIKRKTCGNMVDNPQI
jgi:hypothetical protein